MVDTANSIFRDFVTDGVPASGINKPVKSKIRQWGSWLEGIISGGTAATAVSSVAALKALDTTAVGKATLLVSGRYGDFVWTLGDFSAQVAADTLNGIYIKADAIASTVGAWIRASYLAGDPVTVKWYGAKGDGTTNDSAAIQAAVSALLTAGGGRLYVPGSTGDYICNSGITIDATLASSLSRYGAALTIYGDGPSRSCIKSTTISSPMFLYIGNLLHNESHFRIENIRLAGNTGAPVASSVGLSMSSAAWTTFDRCDIEGFDAGVSATDIDQVAFYNCNIRFNLRGIVCTTGIPITSPNSWTFVNTLIAGNSTYGIYVKNANSFTFVGGSIQYNGRIGVAGGWGVYLDEVGDGYGNALFSGTAFEGNGGAGDFLSTQTANPAVITFNSVGFTRTANASATAVTGAVNNGSGLIRLTMPSTALYSTGQVLYVSGVGGVTAANGQWTVTVIDATHIDLQGSAFAGVYTSGGSATYYGFGTYQLYADGTNANAVYNLSGCLFRSFAPYVPSGARPSIGLANANAKIRDDGTNYFQNSVEKLTYTEAQKISDDGAAWTAYTPTVSAAGGTFTATATGRYKRVGKTVFFENVITTTAYTATPTAPLTTTLPLVAASTSIAAALNMTTVINSTGLIATGLSTCRIWKDGVFPITANSQQLAVSGSYETA